jgi:FKBP-type peptidyl-prolyl cis-trans isomerase SlyD
MEIGKNAVVTIEYTLEDADKKVIETSRGKEPLTYLHGQGALVPGLEKALEGKGAGAQLEVALTPEEGYGRRDESLVRNIPLRKLSDKNPRPGTRTRVQLDGGVRPALVVAVRGDYATVDANHPLAEMTLHFAIEVTAVRPATAEELAHGHVHGQGGHPH